jgi:DNA-binding response OmpR family regulator
MGTVSMTARQLVRGECVVDDLLRVHLTRSEVDMLAVLLITPPGCVVDFDTIIEAMWPNPDTQPLGTQKIISVIKYRLRLKGIETDSCWGRGIYSIPAERRGSRYNMRRPRSLDQLEQWQKAA